MTLVLAICCRGGVIFAADSQATLNAASVLFATKDETDKLNLVADKVVWGGAGAIGTIQRVREQLTQDQSAVKNCLQQGPDQTAHFIQQKVKAVQGAVRSEVLGDEQAKAQYGTEFLFGGFCKGEPFLLLIDPNGAREWKHTGNFTAVGSGAQLAVHAYRGWRHYKLNDLGAQQAEILAYRIVVSVTDTAAYGVGGDVSLAVITKSGAHLLSKDEVKAVNDAMAAWLQEEVELVARLGVPIASSESDLHAELPVEE